MEIIAPKKNISKIIVPGFADVAEFEANVFNKSGPRFHQGAVSLYLQTLHHKAVVRSDFERWRIFQE